MPHSSLSSRAPRRGFTLIELLTVIAIIGILAAILIPVVGMAQMQGRKAKSTANLSSIGKALIAYAQDHHGLLPAPQFGTSNTPPSSPGSSNPRGGTWMQELVGPDYLGGAYDTEAGSSIITVTAWPAVLTCPQFLAVHGPVSDPEIRGFGMNIFPYRADKHSAKFENSYPTQRQAMEKLPNPAKNIIIGTSNAVTMEPDSSGHFVKNGNEYRDGDTQRFKNEGLFLFVEGSVQALNEDEVAKLLNPED